MMKSSLDVPASVIRLSVQGTVHILKGGTRRTGTLDLDQTPGRH
jgi:hypothetical protein